LLENVQRENLNPIEEALGLEKLIKEFKFTQENLLKKQENQDHI
jgi:ParB family chromosome partitioning protein